jgi:hypothetical protein
MEEWTALARTGPDTLLRVAEGTIGLLGALDSAHRNVAARINLLLSMQRGDVAAVSRGRDDVREQPDARTVLDDARRELVRLRELHHMASQVFILYATRLGPEVGQQSQTWAGNHDKTVGHGSWALQSLRSAASHVEAGKDALLMARPFPLLSPEWTAWVSTAVYLFRSAIVEAIKVRHAARRMRDAVTVELEEALVILNR